MSDTERAVAKLEAEKRSLWHLLVGPVATLLYGEMCEWVVIRPESSPEPLHRDFRIPAMIPVQDEFEVRNWPGREQGAGLSDGCAYYGMHGVIACFSDFGSRAKVLYLANLVHLMGGSTRPELDLSVTHVVCNSGRGVEHRVAQALELPIVRSNWVLKAWKQRHNPTFTATTMEFTHHFRTKNVTFCDYLDIRVSK